MKPEISVIIPCYNAAATIGLQLKALAVQQWTGPWEIIVSDNGSTDESLAVVERYENRFSSLRIVNASDRRGPAHARNVGAQAARGEAFLFCDADDEVAPGWLTAMGEALARYDLVGGRLDVERLNPPWIATALGRPGKGGLARLPFRPDMSIAAGCCLGVKRAVHESVGGFDVSWQFLEEADYCIRVQLTGVPIKFVPEAVVYYRRPQSTLEIYRKARNWAPYGVRLYKLYGQHCFSDRWMWRWYWKEWIRILMSLPSARSRGGRAVLSKEIGRQVGRLKGSLVYGAPPGVSFP